MKNKRIIKMISGLLLLIMVFTVIRPLIALAVGDFAVTFEVEDSTKYRLEIDGHRLRVITLETEDSNIIDTMNGEADISNEVDIVCSSNTSCTITMPDGVNSVSFRFNGSAFDITNGNNKINPETVISSSTTLSIKLPSNEPAPNPGGGGDEPHFDGKAYVLWSCGSGVCYHYFDNIPDFNDGKSTFYKDTSVTADNKNGVTFDVYAEYRGWYTKGGLEDWIDDYEIATGHEVDWNTLDPEIILGEPEQNVGQYEAGAIDSGCERPAEDAHWSVWNEFESCFNHYAATQGNIWARKLQPVGEPDEKNAYVSYGDRNFKVIIYNDNYKGITMGDLSELNYYPSHWTDPFLMRDQFDISGTSKNKPALMDSILLESTVIIRALEWNNFEISSIEALDVPEGAVTINKDNNGDFRIVFSSNFYDNVTFKVTDTDNEVSYVLIKRYTTDGWITFIDNHPVLTADFYFDREKSYTDFDLTAKIIFKDGTIKNVELIPVNRIDDGLGNFTNKYEIDQQEMGGKGLKKSVFQYNLEDGDDRLIQDVYLNAEFKGSTETNYAGAYVGSGEGVLANIYHGEDD